jgi:hypothetical protein
MTRVEQNERITPYRKTHVRFDVDETVLAVPGWADEDGSGKLHPILGSPYIQELGSGGITLGTLEQHHATERGDPLGSVQRASVLNMVGGYTEVAMHRSDSDLTGATTGSDAALASVGDYWLHRRVAATDTWAHSHDADVAAIVQPALATTNYAMDRVIISRSNYPADQAYIIRFRTRGGKHASPDTLHTFYFGGQIYAGGPGPYAVSFTGAGMATLWCMFPTIDGTSKWFALGEWSYCEPHRVMGALHFVSIHPHSGPNGRYIDVHSSPTTTAPPVGGHLLNSTFTPQSTATRSHHFDLNAAWRALAGGGLASASAAAPVAGRMAVAHVPPASAVSAGLANASATIIPPINEALANSILPQIAPGNPAMVARAPASGPGPIRMDVRRNLRPLLQISTHRYYPSGTWMSRRFTVASTTTTPIRISWQANIPDGCSVSAYLCDPLMAPGVSGSQTVSQETAIVAGSRTANRVQYSPVAGRDTYYLTFVLTSNADGSKAPNLQGWRAVKDAVLAANSPGEWTGGTVLEVHLQGPEADPTHEAGSIEIADLKGECTKLRNRGRGSVVIETEYDSTDSTKRSALFWGAWSHSPADRVGAPLSQGMGGNGSTVLYPASDWCEYPLQVTGFWNKRIHEALSTCRFFLADEADPNAFYKITDMMRVALQQTGIPTGQIDIPDSPLTFFPVGDGQRDSLMIEPFSSWERFLVDSVTNYLGWFWMPDRNAGASGMIRLIPPKQPPYTHLATFHISGPGANKLQHSGMAWQGVGIGHTFIYNGTLRYLPQEPECNWLRVIGVGERVPGSGHLTQMQVTLINTKSYNYVGDDGTTHNTADPTSVDYIGTLKPMVITDPALNSWDSLKWFARRTFDIAAHGVSGLSFDAPLMLITDAGDANQTHPRPLRYYDPVSIETSPGVFEDYLVRSCNPDYNSDVMQTAHYEVVKPLNGAGSPPILFGAQL